jgi:DNA-binding response OmpR family regulator
MGARQCRNAQTTDTGLRLSINFQPQLIFVEFSGRGLSAVDFLMSLRRGGTAVRRAPVIVVTGDTRATSIRASRDAGAHEFLCKPFTATNVFRRVENVTLKTRPWVETDAYIGPDRRRFNSGRYDGYRKRESDASAAETSAELAYVNAEVSIRSQLAVIDAMPKSSLRTMLEQSFELQRAVHAPSEEADVQRAVADFQKYLVSAIDQEDRVRPDAISLHLDRIGALRHRASQNGKGIHFSTGHLR